MNHSEKYVYDAIGITKERYFSLAKQVGQKLEDLELERKTCPSSIMAAVAQCCDTPLEASCMAFHAGKAHAMAEIEDIIRS